MKLDYHMGFKDARATYPACGHRRQTRAVGGIVGQTSSSAAVVTNCYNVGTITASDATYAGAVIGYMNNASATAANLYYLTGSCTKGIGTSAASTQTATAKIDSDMKVSAFANELNTDLSAAVFTANARGQYPKLNWQN